MEEFIAVCIVERAMSAKATTVATVRTFPGAIGLEVGYALGAVAAELENTRHLETGNYAAQADDLFRCVTAFVGDLYAVWRLSGAQPSCRDILSYWAETGEMYFPWDDAA